MGKSRLAIKGKLFNLGLNLLKDATSEKKIVATTTSLEPMSYMSQNLPDELPSIEEKLKVLNASLVALEQPDLDRNSIERFRTIIIGTKIYQKSFADYVNYRGLEIEVLELRKRIASLEKSRGSESVQESQSLSSK